MHEELISNIKALTIVVSACCGGLIFWLYVIASQLKRMGDMIEKEIKAEETRQKGRES